MPAARLPVGDPAWMVPFLDSLAREDLAPATLRGYRYDLRHFLAWHTTVQSGAFALDRLAEFEGFAVLTRARGSVTPEPPRRQPEPPPGLGEFEQHVMASDAPAVVLIDRALIRALLRYVRRLERDVGEGF